MSPRGSLKSWRPCRKTATVLRRFMRVIAVVKLLSRTWNSGMLKQPVYTECTAKGNEVKPGGREWLTDGVAGVRNRGPPTGGLGNKHSWGEEREGGCKRYAFARTSLSGKDFFFVLAVSYGVHFCVHHSPLARCCTGRVLACYPLLPCKLCVVLGWIREQVGRASHLFPQRVGTREGPAETACSGGGGGSGNQAHGRFSRFTPPAMLGTSLGATACLRRERKKEKTQRFRCSLWCALPLLLALSRLLPGSLVIFLLAFVNCEFLFAIKLAIFVFVFDISF